MVDMKKENRKLIERNRALYAENQKLKHIMNDICKECAAECGCIVIEGSRTSATYQDLVGILLANNYAVEITPLDERRKLKIVIKESEV